MAYPGTDSELVARAISGEEDALEQLADECLPAVLGWCARLGGPRVDAEDAAHDVMMVLVTRLPRLRDPVAFPYWLFGATRNVVRNHRRRAWLRRWVAFDELPEGRSPGPSAERRMEQDRVAAQVQAVLERLPAPQREVLVLCDLEERTSGEVAALLAIPQGTVKSRLRLARRRFRKEAEALEVVELFEAAAQGAGG